MQRLVSWEGPGKGYDPYDASDPIMTANQRSVYGQSPFRFKHVGDVMGMSARNASGLSWESQHAGLVHAGTKSEALPKG